MISFKDNIGNTLLKMCNFKIKRDGATNWTHSANTVMNALTQLEKHGSGSYLIYHTDWGEDKGPIYARYDDKNKEWINGGHDDARSHNIKTVT